MLVNSQSNANARDDRPAMIHLRLIRPRIVMHALSGRYSLLFANEPIG